MTKIILPLLLLFFCVSDVEPAGAITTGNFAMAVNNAEKCKPSGVETITYFDGRPEFSPEPKPAAPAQNTVVKKKVISKKKTVKKVNRKKVKQLQLAY